jgi:enamine deaminase RidA (YjgF/YER057c/UK114 family)
VPRKLISSGSYLEPEIGFSRAVRVGQFIVVAGTAPIAAAGDTAAPGDVYGQTVRCLEIIGKAIAEAGGTIANVIRTRIIGLHRSHVARRDRSRLRRGIGEVVRPTASVGTAEL